MATYVRHHDGEWFQPKRRGHKLACCNCGVVHTVDYRVVDGHVQLRATGAPRSTAMMRRHRANKKP